MRTLLTILALWLVACGDARPKQPVGGKAIGVKVLDCLMPYQGWITEEIQDELGWYVDPDGEATVRCGDTGPDGGLAEYYLSRDEIVFDPTKLLRSSFPEFETKGASGHDLVHRRIYKGPRPALVRFHVCEWAYNESTPPDCYPSQRASRVLMSPAGPNEWDGDQGTFSLDAVPEYRVTEVDRAFIEWALQ